MHNNVWLVTGAINTRWGLITPELRFQQTLKTLHSIQHHDPQAHVLLLDNSDWDLAPDQITQLQSVCAHMISMGHRKICRIMNYACMKGAAEAHMLLLGLTWIQAHNLNPTRIFKITGRYWLQEKFEAHVHEHIMGKYVFKTRDQHEWGTQFLHTRLWSVCGGLIDHVRELIQKSCAHHVAHACTIEEALFMHMDLTLLTEFDNIHCEGLIAPWNKLIQD
jgi:hypothetical protein